MLFGSSLDRKSTRLNSSHVEISYAVFCLKKTETTAANDGVCADSLTRRAPFTRLTTWSVGIECFFFFLMIRRPPRSTLFPYPPLFRSFAEEVPIPALRERPDALVVMDNLERVGP